MAPLGEEPSSKEVTPGGCSLSVADIATAGFIYGWLVLLPLLESWLVPGVSRALVAAEAGAARALRPASAGLSHRSDAL